MITRHLLNIREDQLFRTQQQQPHTTAKSHKDSFSVGVYLGVRIVQIFSILPMAWVGDRQTRFALVSFRTLYSGVVALAIIARLICNLTFKQEELTAQTVGHIGTVAAHMIAVFILALYAWLARHWPALTLQLRTMEGLVDELRLGAGQGHPTGPHLQARLRIITLVFSGIALVEHIGDKLTTILSSSDSDSTLRQEFETFMKLPPQEILVSMLFEVVATYMAVIYVFNDIFLILVSTTIVWQMNSLNRFLRVAMRQSIPVADNNFWSRVRMTYNGLAKLTNEVDNYICINVLICFTQNLFFICFQLLYFIRNNENEVDRSVYRICSFLYIAIRLLIVAMNLAAINDASRAVRQLLFSVPSRLYCKEVYRLTQQVTTDEIALSGCHFFRVTRSFILTIVGTIATYEIILLQFNKK